MPTSKRSAQAKKLELRPTDFRKNVLALLEKLRTDERAKDAFVRNPVEHIANGVMKAKVSAQKVSEANRLLFSLISNEKMFRWLQTFQPKGAGRRERKTEFASEFAKQIAALGDSAVVTALVSNAKVGNGIPGLTDVAYQCVVSETTGRESSVCTPVAKDSQLRPGRGVDPEMMRVITEALLARANELRQQGALGDLQIEIR